MTPEGKTKAAINRALAKFKSLYKFMPVPSGYGPSSLDYIVCFRGRFISIEAKAPGKKPTPRQAMTMDKMEQAGATVFVIDNTDQLGPLIEALEKLENDNPRKP